MPPEKIAGQDPSKEGSKIEGQETDPPKGDAKVISFTGASGTYEIPETLYNDLNLRFRGEKAALESKYQKQLDEVSGKYTELEDSFKELKKASMTDLEKVELEKKEREEQYSAAQTEALHNRKMYEDYRIQAELQAVVSKYAEKLVSPAHLPMILMSALNPELKDEKVMCNGESLEEAFKKYINLDENKSLLKNDLLSGSGTFASKNKGTGAQDEAFDINKMKGMSNDEINEYMDKFV
jgi:hypothetical protein